MSTEPKKLKDCISNSIKKQEKEYKDQKKKAVEERKEKIKVIKHFFKQVLPRNKEFMFEPVSPPAPFKRIDIQKKLLTGKIEICTSSDPNRISLLFGNSWTNYIEYWYLSEIRWMYDNLPWFETELRRKYGC